MQIYWSLRSIPELSGRIRLFSIAYLFALANFPLWFGWRTAFLLFNGRVWVRQCLLLIAANRAPQQRDHEHDASKSIAFEALVFQGARSHWRVLVTG